ncbi:FAD-dependent oxidoreductase [Nocardioides nitrophenolicus]|uniref:FAD-dependent oxidoreductase n=1 Tax=Nocardioides nitrophenolicus TaxID=60489 RepID=UPI001956C75D|nr:FAD-dependent oxidoreductase [Nocardioides nitrophenolicus]MBM7518861.1 glycine oxidase [Nocardioides nitrophenolicus]
MRVDVLGAGIVGLTVAEELGRRGLDVVVVDPDPVGGASYAAAGMLSPAAEVWHGEEELLRLGLASLRLWPALAARLGVELRRTGTLLAGYDAGDLQQVERQAALLHRHGHRVELLGRAGVRSAEPSLARVAGGALLPEEASVDPRAVCAALLARVELRGTPRPDAEATVVATGTALPEPWRGLVSGVRGEILRLRSDDPPRRTVRGWVGGEAVYLVPRGDGRVVLGATSEAHAGPPVVSAGGALRLLAAGRALWPALDRAELVEGTARDRPATADGLPLVGPAGVAGVVLAAGHYRHGVLLAPLTARLVADHLETGHVEPCLDPRRTFGGEP